MIRSGIFDSIVKKGGDNISGSLVEDHLYITWCTLWASDGIMGAWPRLFWVAVQRTSDFSSIWCCQPLHTLWPVTNSNRNDHNYHDDWQQWGSVSTGRMKPGIGQNNKNKESVDDGEQCVLFYIWAGFFVLSHQLLFVHPILGFVLPVVDYPIMKIMIKKTASSHSNYYCHKTYITANLIAVITADVNEM